MTWNTTFVVLYAGDCWESALVAAVGETAFSLLSNTVCLSCNTVSALWNEILQVLKVPLDPSIGRQC